jgi:hypothetical protein
MSLPLPQVGGAEDRDGGAQGPCRHLVHAAGRVLRARVGRDRGSVGPAETMLVSMGDDEAVGVAVRLERSTDA